MSHKLDEARELFRKGEYSCVILQKQNIFTSRKKGIKPLLEWYSASIDLRGASAVDKVVGKAPAFLYVLFGVSEVYAPVMSKEALKILYAFGIQASYRTLVPFIKNEMRTGMCPIEQAVADIDDPELALEAIQQRLADLAVVRGKV